MAINITPPETGTLSEYYESYRHHLFENDLLKGLVAQGEMTNQFIKSLPEKQGDVQYQTGKWTIKEVLGHIADCERIFQYRILSFARGERQSLPGFDENDYAHHSNYKSRTLKDIAEELYAIRQSTIQLVANLDQSVLDDQGVANNNPVSIRGLIYFSLVHERHHIWFIKRHYLVR